MSFSPMLRKLLQYPIAATCSCGISGATNPSDPLGFAVGWILEPSVPLDLPNIDGTEMEGISLGIFISGICVIIPQGVRLNAGSMRRICA